MAKIKHWIDLGVLGEDVDCVVEYDYQPRESRTAYYPGCDEKITIEGVTVEGVSLSEESKNLIIDSLRDDDSLLDKIDDYEMDRGQ